MCFESSASTPTKLGSLWNLSEPRPRWAIVLNEAPDVCLCFRRTGDSAAHGDASFRHFLNMSGGMTSADLGFIWGFVSAASSSARPCCAPPRTAVSGIEITFRRPAPRTSAYSGASATSCGGSGASAALSTTAAFGDAARRARSFVGLRAIGETAEAARTDDGVCFGAKRAGVKRSVGLLLR